VRHVGDVIAFVFAERLERAKDAAKAIVVVWEELSHVIDASWAAGGGLRQPARTRIRNILLRFIEDRTHEGRDCVFLEQLSAFTPILVVFQSWRDQDVSLAYHDDKSTGVSKIFKDAGRSSPK
jgi:hypothetical protein